MGHPATETQPSIYTCFNVKPPGGEILRNLWFQPTWNRFSHVWNPESLFSVRAGWAILPP
jgi:hypothetical protein